MSAPPIQTIMHSSFPFVRFSRVPCIVHSIRTPFPSGGEPLSWEAREDQRRGAAGEASIASWPAQRLHLLSVPAAGSRQEREKKKREARPLSLFGPGWLSRYPSTMARIVAQMPISFLPFV